MVEPDPRFTDKGLVELRSILPAEHPSVVKYELELANLKAKADAAKAQGGGFAAEAKRFTTAGLAKLKSLLGDVDPAVFEYSLGLDKQTAELPVAVRIQSKTRFVASLKERLVKAQSAFAETFEKRRLLNLELESQGERVSHLEGRIVVAEKEFADLCTQVPQDGGPTPAAGSPGPVPPPVTKAEAGASLSSVDLVLLLQDRMAAQAAAGDQHAKTILLNLSVTLAAEQTRAEAMHAAAAKANAEAAAAAGAASGTPGGNAMEQPGVSSVPGVAAQGEAVAAPPPPSPCVHVSPAGDEEAVAAKRLKGGVPGEEPAATA